MIKLVATDLDGTIINHANQCAPEVARKVKELHESGIHFAVCSGRPVDSYIDMLKDWGLDEVCDYVIGSNGGEVLDRTSGTKIEKYTLEPELVREIIEAYRPLNMIPTVYAGTTLYVERMSEQVEILAKRVGVHPVVADLDTVLTKPQTKEMFILEPEKMAEAEAYAAAHPDSRYTAYKTAVDLLEFTHPKLGKDVGIGILKELLALQDDEIMTFGDTTNDIPMLTCVKYGICLANGSDDAKQAAFAIAPSIEENGFVQYLDRHLSGNEFID